MKYYCGHEGCDICGVRTCDEHMHSPCVELVEVKDDIVCKSCLGLAVSFAVQAAETFGGTIIDLEKSCGSNVRGRHE